MTRPGATGDFLERLRRFVVAAERRQSQPATFAVYVGPIEGWSPVADRRRPVQSAPHVVLAAAPACPAKFRLSIKSFRFGLGKNKTIRYGTKILPRLGNF